MIGHGLVPDDEIPDRRAILSDEEALAVAKAVIAGAGGEAVPEDLIEQALMEISMMVTGGALAELVLKGILVITRGEDGELRYGAPKDTSVTGAPYLN